jgi:3-hydroxyacyl-CoA dehydrogenase
MKRVIRKAAVLGSGVMGSAIAAHLAGCGIEVLMLDIVPFDNMLTDEEKARKDTDPRVRNKLAIQSLEAAMKVKKPTPVFFSPDDAKLITLGNFDDDLPKIKQCDWILECVVERMDIKKQILAKAAKHRRKGVIVSTNTSGLSVREMVAEQDAEFKAHFMGTHFFNPVRHMKLLEIIPHPENKKDAVDFMKQFCAETLGKGVILCKDTPDFVANRIGVHGIMDTIKLMVELDYRVDEVDAIVGPALGRPKTAAFKTVDLVGVDIIPHVAATVYDNVPTDPQRDVFQSPAFLTDMVKRRWLGNKTNGGFYKREGKSSLVVDYKTMAYVPTEKFLFDSVGEARNAESVAEKLRIMCYHTDKAGVFAWKLMADSLIYTAAIATDIADSIVEIDRGLRWGFNFQLGPFEGWDAIGVRKSVERMKAEGRKVPECVEKMLAAGHESFYKEEGGVLHAFNLATQKYDALEQDQRIFTIAKFDEDREVAKNTNATVWDIGDGVLLLEFHSKMNAIDPEIIAMMNEAMDLMEDDYEGMVVANQADNFSVGANIFVLMMAAQAKQLNRVEEMAKALQDTNMRMKYFPKPIVTAPAGMALGGGCEVTLHGQAVQAFAETYIGLVEVGVGLLPGGGGCKELVLRLTEGIRGGAKPPILPFAMKAFEMVGKAYVAIGAKEAQDAGILRPTDRISFNRDYQIHDAKQLVLGMRQARFNPGRPKTNIPAAGAYAKAAFIVGIDQMYQAGWATEYDRVVGGKVAHVIAGGDVAEGTLLSEQHYLDLEREAFMSLLGEQRTMDRITHMLNTGKPLRN